MGGKLQDFSSFELLFHPAHSRSSLSAAAYITIHHSPPTLTFGPHSLFNVSSPLSLSLSQTLSFSSFFSFSFWNSLIQCVFFTGWSLISWFLPNHFAFFSVFRQCIDLTWRCISPNSAQFQSLKIVTVSLCTLQWMLNWILGILQVFELELEQIWSFLLLEKWVFVVLIFFVVIDLLLWNLLMYGFAFGSWKVFFFFFVYSNSIPDENCDRGKLKRRTRCGVCVCKVWVCKDHENNSIFFSGLKKLLDVWFVLIKSIYILFMMW